MSYYGFKPNCKRVSLEKLIINNQKEPIQSLCDTCAHLKCGNPIETKYISIFGINKTMKVYNSYGFPSIVVSCEGYQKKV